jgi:RNA polymerase sigma factor (sigma-70 family)
MFAPHSARPRLIVTFQDPEWLAQEAKLLEGIRRGDRAACEALYRAFAAPLANRVLWPRLSDRDLVADALAETFRRFFERLGDYQTRGCSVWSWLATIAANKANDIYRAQARGGRALHNYHVLLDPLWAGSGPPRPDELHEQTCLRDAVGAVLGGIHPRYRRALELRFLEDRPRSECAQALAVTLGTFDVLLLRALRAFRTAWQAQFPASEATS